MRIFESVYPLNFSIAPRTDASSQAGSIAVQRDDQRLVEAAVVVRIRGVAQMMLNTLQLAAQADLAQTRFKLLVPLLVELRRFFAPLLRSTLGHVAGNHAFARQHFVRNVLEKAL